MKHSVAVQPSSHASSEFNLLPAVDLVACGSRVSGVRKDPCLQVVARWTYVNTLCSTVRSLTAQHPPPVRLLVASLTTSISYRTVLYLYIAKLMTCQLASAEQNDQSSELLAFRRDAVNM